MSGVFNWLFGTRTLGFGDAGVELQFARQWPLWVWVLIALAAAVFAGLTYVRLKGNVRARTALAVLRTLALLALVAMIAGPQLVKQNERVEQDWVVVMADRSASMTIADVQPGASGVRETRESQLREALTKGAPMLTQLRSERNVLALGFDASTFDLGWNDNAVSKGEPAFALAEPAGQRTALGTSLDAALRRVAAKPVAGLVLMTDGRSFDAPSRALVQQLQERQIAVYPVALGSVKAIADVAVSRLEAPTSAFVGDIVPVSVDVDVAGASSGNVPTGKVQLVDASGRVLDEKPLPGAEKPRVTLSSKADAAGATSWRVKLVLDQEDLATANNEQAVAVELVDRPIRVLYIDGYPRWEYRYVKNLLLREPSVKSTMLLLASEKRYIQEGTDRIATLPRTQQEWAAFDVVIVGDVRSALFSEEQLQNLRSVVAERGVGILWIGGESFTPGSWAATPLADLVPFSFGSDSTTGISRFNEPVLMKPGAAASGFGVLQLADGAANDQTWPDALSDAKLGWPKLQWAQRIERSQLKPASEVIASATPTLGDASKSYPLVMTMRYGAGRSIYVATDETWRYRYGRGEALTERFWVPLVRLLARGSLGRSGKPATIEASPATPLVNQPVRVTLRLLDQALIERRAGEVEVGVTKSGATGAVGGTGASTRIVLRPESASIENASVATYTGLWVPGEAGAFAIAPADALLAGLELSASVNVVLPEDELRRPQTDHAALAELAQATGGRVLMVDELADLPKILPNREVRLLGTPEVETLWDKPVALLLLLVLLSGEWIGRRLLRLA